MPENRLSQWFREFTGRNVKPSATAGVPSVPMFNGYIQNSERDPKLASTLNRYNTYSEMIANTTIIAAGIRYFLNLVGKATWRVEPADESDEAKRIADTIYEIMHDARTPWHRVVRRSSMYKFYGFSVQEWTAKKRPDGSIGFLDIAPRAPFTIDRWATEPDGNVVGVIQTNPNDFTEIWLPRDKLVYMVDDSLNDSPEGLGILRHLYETNERLKRFQQLEGFGFETDLRGIPVGRAPIRELQELVDGGKLSASKMTEILAPLKTFIENHIKGPKLGMILDSSVYESQDEASTPTPNPLWNLSLLQSPGSGTSLPEVAQSIIRCQREMARVLGVEQLLLGEGRGAFSLSKDKSQAFALTIDSALLEVSQQYKFDILGPLMRLNGWNPLLTPVLTTESMRFQDIEVVTKAIASLATAGATLNPIDPAIDEIRTMIGLSASIPMILEEENDISIDKPVPGVEE